jgi:O-antigen ligase
MGYGNANGALYALGVAAAAILAVCANSDTIRIPAGVLTVSMFAFTVLTTSIAASALALGILLVAVAVHRFGRRFALAGPFFLMGTIGLTLLVGLGPDLQVVSLAEQALTKARATLWHDALAITADHPVFGAGPGTFAELSPTALSDSDLRWAHSAYLQAAAEMGIPGAVLLLAILLWAFGGLVRSHQDERLVVIGIAAAIAFTVHAGIDYIAHFPALVILVALLTGLASSRRAPTSRHETGNETH